MKNEYGQDIEYVRSSPIRVFGTDQDGRSGGSFFISDKN
jgi:hypothetical protein